jgi:hypothetical protein
MLGETLQMVQRNAGVQEYAACIEMAVEIHRSCMLLGAWLNEPNQRFFQKFRPCRIGNAVAISRCETE